MTTDIKELVDRLTLNVPCFGSKGNKRKKLCGDDGGLCPECRKKQDAANALEEMAGEVERLRIEKVAGGHAESVPEEVESFSRTPAADPAPVCEWKPIETAPKDGTEFIVFRDDAGVFAARYVEPSNDDGEMFLASMYGEDLTGDMMPTHWMPLPPPPEAKE